MKKKARPSRLGLLICSLLVLGLVSPAPLGLYTWQGEALFPMPFLTGDLSPVHSQQADLDKDGNLEQVALEGGVAHIRRQGQELWRSPAGWEVTQAEISDFNADGRLEVSLLLWRAFAPWPIDSYIVHPGRIDGFHDRRGQSCHFILIGWRKEAFVELWAGSALVDPLLAFSPIDLNQDGRQELIALESRYDEPTGSASAVTVWEWNGFGFTLLSRGPFGHWIDLRTVSTLLGPEMLLIQGIPGGE